MHIPVTLLHDRQNSEYVAEITGLDDRFVFARNYLKMEARTAGRYAKDVRETTTYLVTRPGFYEFRQVVNGTLTVTFYHIAFDGHRTPKMKLEITSYFENLAKEKK